MTIRVAPCPGCGAEVRFDVRTSHVTICEHCSSAVARGDRGVESLGKVADLAETDSPLAVGMTGKSGLPFRIVGRVQLKAPSGALWNEWFVYFGDGRDAWLAEEQGNFYLTLPRSLPLGAPRLEDLVVGRAAVAGGIPPGMVVREIGRAVLVSAEGELPFLPRPGEEYGYADLSGNEGRFGTLDYGTDPPRFFYGKSRTLAQLGIAALAKGAAGTRAVTGQKISCPKCGGPLALRAPDLTERVGCPFCGSLLDARKGQLTLLQALAPAKDPRFRPRIPLGASGELERVRQTVIGFLVRETSIAGETYAWQEYLLYSADLGFRWLVCGSDQGWTYVTGVDPGSVTRSGGTARQDGHRFRLDEEYTARVVYVSGEIYWRVEAGETVRVRDYSSFTGKTLSEEETLASPGGRGGASAVSEVNWSRGEPISAARLQKVFSLKHPLARRSWTSSDGDSSDDDMHGVRASNAVGLLSEVPVPVTVIVIVAVIVLIFIVAANTDGGGGYSSRGWGGSGGGFSFGGK